jgi:hypothetical protein
MNVGSNTHKYNNKKLLENNESKKKKLQDPLFELWVL